MIPQDVHNAFRRETVSRVIERMKEARQEEALRAIMQSVRGHMDQLQEDAFLGKPATRTFVCQGCGVARAILHGNSVVCGCGVTSSAEVLPPEQTR